MSIAEIKEEAKNMKASEVRHLAAYFHHLSRRSEAGYTEGLDKAWEAMGKGDKVSLADLKHLDQELRGVGL